MPQMLKNRTSWMGVPLHGAVTSVSSPERSHRKMHSRHSFLPTNHSREVVHKGQPRGGFQTDVTQLQSLTSSMRNEIRKPPVRPPTHGVAGSRLVPLLASPHVEPAEALLRDDRAASRPVDLPVVLCWSLSRQWRLARPQRAVLPSMCQPPLDLQGAREGPKVS
jgi:hypothetical protein